MKDHRVAEFLLVSILVICIIGVSGPSGAQDQTVTVSSSPGQVEKSPAPVNAPPFTNLAPGDAVLTVTGSALRPRASDITFASIGSGGGIYCTGTGTSFVVFNTPLNLPQGTLVKSLRMYFYDSDPSQVCYGVVTQYDLFGNFVHEWWATSPTGSVGAGYADSPAINHTIDNTQYSYLLNWVPVVYNSNMQLRALQLNYKPSPSASSKVAVIPLN